jgi:MFS family permease
VFLLIIKPIADEFRVPTTEVAIVFTLTLWMRLVGAVGSGLLADRIGRKTPLMISIFWYFGLQLHRRVFADFCVSIDLPHIAWHRHGR